MIENARLAERMVAEERLRRELALAAEVQRRLLPERPPECLAVELAGFCQPARGVGGDYYDFIKFDNERLGIAIEHHLGLDETAIDDAVKCDQCAGWREAGCVHGLIV